MAGVVNTCPDCGEKAWDGDQLTCKCAQKRKCGKDCVDDIHAGTDASLQAAIEFVNKVGCLEEARRALDTLEAARNLLERKRR